MLECCLEHVVHLTQSSYYDINFPSLFVTKTPAWNIITWVPILTGKLVRTPSVSSNGEDTSGINMGVSKARSRFREDLKSAAEKAFDHVSNVQKGDTDDEFIFSLSYPNVETGLSYEIRVHVQS